MTITSHPWALHRARVLRAAGILVTTVLLTLPVPAAASAATPASSPQAASMATVPPPSKQDTHQCTRTRLQWANAKLRLWRAATGYADRKVTKDVLLTRKAAVRRAHARVLELCPGTRATTPSSAGTCPTPTPNEVISTPSPYVIPDGVDVATTQAQLRALIAANNWLTPETINVMTGRLGKNINGPDGQYELVGFAQMPSNPRAIIEIGRRPTRELVVLAYRAGAGSRPVLIVDPNPFTVTR